MRNWRSELVDHADPDVLELWHIYSITHECLLTIGIVSVMSFFGASRPRSTIASIAG